MNFFDIETFAIRLPCNISFDNCFFFAKIYVECKLLMFSLNNLLILLKRKIHTELDNMMIMLT